MKLAIVGGGGFRVPQIIEVLARARAGAGPHAQLVVDHVALHDTAPSRLRAMKAVLTALDYPCSPVVSSHTDLDEALAGADFVFSAMRVGGTRGRVLDERCALEEGLLGQETVGVGGYAYALRTLGPALDLARAVRRAAPGAWVINFTNPAGIITQAMRSVLGRRVVGICDTPISLVRRTCAALGLDPSAAERSGTGTDFDYVGLNHLGWLRSLRVDGVDLLPGLLADDARLDALEEARTIGADWLRAIGAVPNEYLFYYYCHREALAGVARSRTRGEFLDAQQGEFYEAVAADPARAGALWEAAHARREATYMAEARSEDERDGRREEDIAGGGYQRVALDLMTALSTGEPARMILDVGNADSGSAAIASLADEAVVEVPCDVDGDGIHPRRVAPLTGAPLGLVQSVKACEDLVIEAVRRRDESLAWRALALHPLVDSVRAARRVLDSYIARNPLVAAVFD